MSADSNHESVPAPALRAGHLMLDLLASKDDDADLASNQAAYVTAAAAIDQALWDEADADQAVQPADLVGMSYVLQDWFLNQLGTAAGVDAPTIISRLREFLELLRQGELSYEEIYAQTAVSLPKEEPHADVRLLVVHLPKQAFSAGGIIDLSFSEYEEFTRTHGPGWQIMSQSVVSSDEETVVLSFLLTRSAQ
ncbi:MULTISPECIES: hypothetical protein [unclassified Pseudoclavibacter]|uniref:hypothetical protein n=1 Tax=unclassified Pseudoclavibacter TaxID=2615177 RepID=UPI001BAC61EA|nr:hypothetical protein [Pseudoclavibacter sp. Marseille-Q4354]MBS3177253.1 hypothetical protein [Pseudoclavibacter sp. Marseille-Q4354]